MVRLLYACVFDLVDSYRPNACLARRKAKRTSQGGRTRSDYMYLAAKKLEESGSTMMIRIVQMRERSECLGYDYYFGSIRLCGRRWTCWV
jgi:hypothetical protein